MPDGPELNSMAGPRPDDGDAAGSGPLRSGRFARASLVVGAAAVALAGSLLLSLHSQFLPARSPTQIPAAGPVRATVAVQSQFIDSRHGWSEIAHPPDETSDGLYATTDGGRTWRLSF
ncbi:MAG: hypothetical protein J2P45_21395, partial [Candidatus Dormibacteraeota bacterium]|nr:hypothetical protein [Candidatus Dormibacteraeota bacterium]